MPAATHRQVRVRHEVRRPMRRKRAGRIRHKVRRIQQDARRHRHDARRHQHEVLRHRHEVRRHRHKARRVHHAVRVHHIKPILHETHLGVPLHHVPAEAVIRTRRRTESNAFFMTLCLKKQRAKWITPF